MMMMTDERMIGRLPAVGMATRPVNIEDALLAHDSEEIDFDTEASSDYESCGLTHVGDTGWAAWAALLRWERSSSYRPLRDAIASSSFEPKPAREPFHRNQGV